MNRLTTLMLAMAIATGGVAAGAAQAPSDEQRALRARIEVRYDVVPLSDAIGLRPKMRNGDVRLIEVSDGAIAINGTPVTGRELRERVGADADLILRLSYLDADARRALFAAGSGQPSGGLPDVEARTPPSTSSTPTSERARRARGDRVRVFGDVAVEKDESVSGQVVAVIGSVRVDGEVGDQVVAVLGSVHLGPDAVVRGDVVSVGGAVDRAPTARIGGSVTEVALTGGPRVDVGPYVVGWRPWYFGGFGSIPRLIGSSFRLLLLMLLGVLALVLARPAVERAASRVHDEPVKSTVVGLAAEILIVPVLVLACVVLAVSIIGIPLLLLIPFAVLFLVLMALVGFTGAAAAAAQWARRRFGLGGGSPFLDVCLGIFIILLPLLLGRVLALAGWPITPAALFLVAAGFAVELLAWAGGFGAVLMNLGTRWQARRAARAPQVPQVP